MKKLFGILLALVSAAAFGTTTVPVQLLNPTGSASGQTIVSTGASTAPGWSTLGLSGLSAISANTLVGNATGSSAAPTAVAVTGCNGAAQALQWTSGSGFGCNSNIATAGANSNITSLTGLTTPLGTWAGGLGANNSAATGIPVFSSGAVTVTPSPALLGISNGGSAAAGYVGEVICAQVTNGGTPTGCTTNSSTPVSLTTGITANVASISLTAGDWIIFGTVCDIPGASTVISARVAEITTVSATLSNAPNFGAISSIPFSNTGTGACFPVGQIIQNISATTTFYLVANNSFTTSTDAAYGFISARRWH